jgi:hypothetical protein
LDRRSSQWVSSLPFEASWPPSRGREPSKRPASRLVQDRVVGTCAPDLGLCDSAPNWTVLEEMSARRRAYAPSERSPREASAGWVPKARAPMTGPIASNNKRRAAGRRTPRSRGGQGATEHRLAPDRQPCPIAPRSLPGRPSRAGSGTRRGLSIPCQGSRAVQASSPARTLGTWLGVGVGLEN